MSIKVAYASVVGAECQLGRKPPCRATVLLVLFFPETWPMPSTESTTSLNGGKWWAPSGGTCPRVDLICRIRFHDEDGLLFVEAKAREGAPMLMLVRSSGVNPSE